MKHEEVTKDDILITEKPGMLQQKLLEMEHFQSIYKKDSLVKMSEVLVILFSASSLHTKSFLRQRKHLTIQNYFASEF